MLIKTGAITGAITGAVIAILLLSLKATRPFSIHTNSLIERLTFRLCPLYILGFSNDVQSMTGLIIITLLGNIVIYAIGFTIVALLVKGAKRTVTMISAR